MENAKLKSIVRKINGPKRKLVFAEDLTYSAFKGYQKPVTNCSILRQNVASTPQNCLIDSPTVDHSVNSSQVETQPSSVQDEDFKKMIDDMAFKVWKCGRCLSMGHLVRDCTNEIRCRACYSYGHIKKQCLKFRKKAKAQIWVPKESGPLPKGEAPEQTPAVSSSPGNINLSSEPTAVVLPSPSSAPNLDSSPAMAVFEVDPTPWLPWGHQVIDGGPTRLPRTFYNAPQDPLQQHQDHCIAIIEPAPPPADEIFWRQQVLNFLIGPLNRNVLDNQPSLFGAGLFQLSSPNAVNALIQHGHYQLHNRFVRFIGADDAPQNHRAALGFRRGWLMILGTPPDYRNDFDISSAVATFGKFHHWNRDDPIKERILVYASFVSPALVPRDVVFGKFSTVGGVRESWTAPVFILSADFAEQLPADEDPMPPDGNPHPMPGNLQPNLNLFVQPQFPEIGWDAVQDQPEEPIDEPMQANENQMVDNQQSMVLDLSDNSSSSVNMAGAVQGPGNFNVLQVGRVELRPILPPHMMWDKLMLSLLPALYANTIPLSMQMSPFRNIKRTWDTAFQFGSICASAPANDKRFFLTVKPRAAQGDFCFTAQDMSASDASDEQDCQDNGLCEVLDTASTEASLPDDAMSPVSSFSLGLLSVPSGVKVRKRRTATPADPAFQRGTRSVSSGKGFRAAPIKELQPRPMKRTRKVQSSSIVVASVRRCSDGQRSTDKKKDEPDATSAAMVAIPVMQRIGELLQMDPEDLTEAKLTAKPCDDDASSNKSDD
jgi:hypothetical protein